MTEKNENKTNNKRNNRKRKFPEYEKFSFGEVLNWRYSAFFRVTVVPFSSMLTSQLTISPGLISKNFLTCCGIINLAESNLLLPFPTLDLYLNIGIISILLLITNIFVLTSINTYTYFSLKDSVKVYILEKPKLTIKKGNLESAISR